MYQYVLLLCYIVATVCLALGFLKLVRSDMLSQKNLERHELRCQGIWHLTQGIIAIWPILLLDMLGPRRFIPESILYAFITIVLLRWLRTAQREALALQNKLTE